MSANRQNYKAIRQGLRQARKDKARNIIINQLNKNRHSTVSSDVTQHVIDLINKPSLRIKTQEHDFSDLNPESPPIKHYKASLYQKIMRIRRDELDEKNLEIESNFFNFRKHTFWLRKVSSLLSSDIIATKNRTERFMLNYARLMYAYFSSALTIIELLKQDCDQQTIVINIDIIIKKFNRRLNKILSDQTDSSRSTEELEQVILDLLGDTKWKLVEYIDDELNEVNLAELGLKGSREQIISKMLDQAKDWVGIEQPTLPVYTLFDIDPDTLLTGEKSKRFIIADVPCTELTQVQKKVLRNRKNEAWYQSLNLFQQKMIDYYAYDILAGNRAIPSQLRSVIPVSRNAYRQAIFIENANGSFIEEGSCYHTGTAAYLRHDNDDVALAATIQNLQQQKLNSDADVCVMIALNSQIADAVVGTLKRVQGQQYVSDDSKIIELTSRAAQEAGCKVHRIFYSKLCLNGARNFEFNEYSGINAVYSSIRNNISCLTQLGIDDEETQSSIREIDKLIDDGEKLAATKIWNDTEIKGTDILYYLTRAATLSNRLVEMHKEKSRELLKVAVWMGCASGENRTGLAYYHILRQTMVDHLQKTGALLTDHVVTKISNIMADSQHVHIMTGGTFGTEGIRGKSAGSAKPHDPKEKLITHTADMKIITPYHTKLDHVLRKLQAAIKDNYHNETVADMLPYAINLHQYVCDKKSQLFSLNLSKDDRKNLILALQVTSNLLNEQSSKNINQVGTVIGRLTKLEDQNRLHPVFQDNTKRSLKLTVLGCLLGIASVAVAAFSITAFIGTLGLTTPLSALGLVFAGTLAKAASATIAVTACATFGAGTLFYKHGRQQHKNVIENLIGLYEEGAKKPQPSSPPTNHRISQTLVMT